VSLPGESEKHFQREVIRLCKALRKRTFFTQRSVGSPPGWPDLAIVDPPWLHLRELKTNTGRNTPTQEEVQALLKQCQYVDVGVWRPIDWPRIVEELKP